MANTFVTLQFIRMISLKRHKHYQQKMKILTGLPWWSSGYTVLPVKGAWVQFLVRELDPIYYKTGITKEIKEIN